MMCNEDVLSLHRPQSSVTLAPNTRTTLTPRRKMQRQRCSQKLVSSTTDDDKAAFCGCGALDKAHEECIGIIIVPKRRYRCRFHSHGS